MSQKDVIEFLKTCKGKKWYNPRGDGRIEWVCRHGVGHTIYSIVKEPSWFVHGCDGCCNKTEFIEVFKRIVELDAMK